MSKNLAMSPSARDRFWSYVDTNGDCWEWRGGTTSFGYGNFFLDTPRGLGLAHRVSWWEHFGLIPPGMMVCHSCDNPGCVNPSHLFLGTHKDNMIDRSKKGRAPRGESSHYSRMTEPDVVAIREFAASVDWSYVRLAKHFGMSTCGVRSIITGESWAHAPGPLRPVCRKEAARA